MLKTTALPGRDEIMRRLAAVNDSPWNIEHFYPLIAAAADSERAGAAQGSILAVADLTDCHQADGACCHPWGESSPGVWRVPAEAAERVLAQIGSVAT